MEFTIEQGITFEDLSKTSQAFAEVIGIPATLKIINEHKGRLIHIPRKADEGFQLCELLGKPVASELCRAFGGTQIEVPIEAKLQRKLKHQAILKRKSAGVPVQQIAEEFGASRRHVYQILKDIREGKVL